MTTPAPEHPASLGEMLGADRGAILAAAREKIVQAGGTAEADDIDAFLDLLVALLAGDARAAQAIPILAHARAAREHRAGRRIDQLVHEFGAVCSAITERAAAHGRDLPAREYQILNSALDDLIAAGVAEFESAAVAHDVVAAAERIGLVVHEMRNAVSAALAAVGFIRAGKAPIAGRTGEVLQRSLDRLHRLIDELLVRVKLGSSQPIRHEPVDLVELVAEAADALAPEGERRGVRITVAPGQPARVGGDPAMLASAVSNLVQNAIKFTREGGLVSIAVEGSGPMIEIRVTDECGGLPPGGAERLFAPFQQAAADRSGVGLGLTIVRDVVVAHGGRVRAIDRPGIGCVFVLELPRG